MPLTCECGASFSLPQIAATRCGIDFKQIQLGAFVDLSDMPETGTPSTSLALRTNIVDKSVWAALLAASPAKVVLTPELFNFTDTPGDEVTWEGNNGIQEHVSTNATQVTAELRRCTMAQAKEMNKLLCLAQVGKLGLWLFDTTGNVLGVNGKISADNDAVMPFNVSKFFLSDRTFAGMSEPDYYAMNLEFPAEWSFDMTYEALDTVGGSTSNWRGIDLLS